jgi:hypothetical protein
MACSLLPRRTEQEQREFLTSFLSEAMSIIDNDYGFGDEGDHDDSAEDDDKRGSSSNSNDYGDRKQ